VYSERIGQPFYNGYVGSAGRVGQVMDDALDPSRIRWSAIGSSSPNSVEKRAGEGMPAVGVGRPYKAG